MKDPNVGTMQALRAGIRGCPEPVMLPDAGHFVQENGQAVVHSGARYQSCEERQ
jgi:tRNA(adenine34) deaminase